MEKYEPIKIEQKWQEIWAKTEIYKADDFSKKEKYYCLVEFPYPSGDFLHMGHGRSYNCIDSIARFQRMKGKNVLFPMGWDAFGLPAENYAIKTGIHPAITTKKNIENAKKQLISWGCSFDWSREINTTDPKYYKWTQWIFLKLYEMGLAYKSKMAINWCPSCKIGLANEEVISGKCERCGADVERREIEQWMLKITAYADRLIDDLKEVDYISEVKTQQINWIGRSVGTEIDFPIKNYKDKIKVFTTRVDTIFGCTYVILAPEHELVERLKPSIKNWAEVENYVKKSQKKSDLERAELQKEKTGVKIDGLVAINPFNKAEIPIFIADYVLANYGTGAVMAVPAHDERDLEFAKKYKIPVVESIIPKVMDKHDPPKDGAETIFRQAVQVILINPKNNKVLCLKWKKFPWTTFITGGIEGNEDVLSAAKRETFEETGYKDIEYVKTLGGPVESHFYANHKGVNRKALFTALVFNLKSDKRSEISAEEAAIHDIAWVTWDELHRDKNVKCAEYEIWLDRFFNEKHAFTDDGVLIDSGKFTSLTSSEARKKMSLWLEKNKSGGEKVNYKLRDWVFSRQHYWGEPIPIVYCEKCGEIPLLEKDLPLELPKVDRYEPTNTGESPLASITDWVNTKCPKCGGKAKRETDTMPNWAGSSWYFIRYTDPTNDKFLADRKKMDYWLPVDIYNGGMEHTTLHLLYSRFWYKALSDAKVVPGKEPYKRRISHGFILGADGQKMSKSRGNVIIPNEIIEKYGADTFRLYEMFIGPYDETAQWSPQGLEGVSRFLKRFWEIFQKPIEDSEPDMGQLKIINKLIKKITDEIMELKFNTIISSFMAVNNELIKNKKQNKQILELLLIVFAPFAPHITEELWYNLGNKESVHLQSWPSYDSKLLEDEAVNIVIQINGKVRDQLLVLRGTKEETILKAAKESDRVKKYLAGAKIIKVIYIHDKLLSLVIKQ